jgi:hypothetical protein
MSSCNVLFVWVPKVAGTSIYRVLLAHGCPPHLWDIPSHPFANSGVATFGHVSISALVEHGTLTNEFLDSAFKFAFVRNPYERLVSLYFYLNRIRNSITMHCPTFLDFCLCLGEDTIPQVGFYNYFKLSQCNPMTRWTHDNHNRQIVDYIGRYENLQKDWSAVCSLSGLSGALPMSNNTAHDSYRNYYCMTSKRIIEKIYRDDLERYSYIY